jgi:NAD dependent epimerase/dehydratase family enzyme
LLLGPELADALLFTSARVVPNVLTTSGYSFANPTIASALHDVLTQPTAA